MIQRRTFLTGLAALITAPAIVRAGSLMPVRSVVYAPALSGRAIALMQQQAEAMYIPVHPDIWRDLVEMRKQLMREYFSENLFQPYRELTR